MIRTWVKSAVLIAGVVAVGAGLAAWKMHVVSLGMEAAAQQPEPVETISAVLAVPREHARMTSAIGTVVAMRSITLRNEVPGTVRQVALVPGQIVEAGTVLVALDVSVEEAELAALEAQAALAATSLERTKKASLTRAVAENEVDRALAERDVALAHVARLRAVIERKTIRAPFRARVGLADVHPGQYLDEGTTLTTLQGVMDEAYVDFAVPQRVAAALRPGDRVAVIAAERGGAVEDAVLVAVDARVDEGTRNTTVRARMKGAPKPGASVRVEVPVGETISGVAIPAQALRKGPAGEHVFVLASDETGAVRARTRVVTSGPFIGDDVLILTGLAPGEQVAATGSFKLYEGVRVALAEMPVPQDDGIATAAR